MLPRLMTAAFVAVGITAAALPAAASAYVTPEAAQLAADRAVGWFRTAQQPSGEITGGGVRSFGGDWSMVALANAGVNAADLQPTLAGPSLQDFYAASWASSPTAPGTLSTDQARALLAGYSGGIRGARLSASRNLLARQLRFFDGKQLGLAGTVNDDMFGSLALRLNGVDDLTPALDREVRRAQTGGGWNYTTNGGSPDIDMTGAGIATLCANGATADDPAVAQALDVIDALQDDTSGGFVSDVFGANSDSTSWVVNGLRQCGLDPQGPRWTTSTGKTPLDFLVAMQKSNGAFRWRPSEADDTNDNLYSTQDAVTALVGSGFTAAPPARVAGQETFRAAPAVAAGTDVPVALIIDHDPATPGPERACSVKAPVGGTVADALAATPAADPLGCAADVAVTAPGARGELRAVNGVVADAGRKWVVSVDGGAPSDTLAAELPLGAVVRATLVARGGGGSSDPGIAGGDPTSKSAATPTPLPAATRAQDALPRGAKATLRVGKRLALRRGGVAVGVGCPRGLGAGGCRGVVRITYMSGQRRREAGSAAFTVASGATATVRVRMARAFRKLVARRGRAIVIEAATRDQATRSTTRTRASTHVRG